MNHTAGLTKIALMTAILCILSPISIPIGISPVPVSLSLFAICLTIILLGLKDGIISVILYIILGFIGLPIFSGYTGSVSVLLSPTGGYILGYIPLCIIAGLFVRKFNSNKLIIFCGMLLGTISCYLVGTVYLCIITNINFPTALLTGVVPFIVFDITKIWGAILVGMPIKKALNK